MNKNKRLRAIWYGLSPNQRYFVRRVYHYPLDILDKITGKTNKYVPPRGLIYTGSAAGSENYIAQGKHQLEILKNNIDLSPGDSVLDVGSGVGRTAIALSGYLNEKGSYEGFDVVEKGVTWCNKKIKPDFPNFNFTYTPIFNDLYNDSGAKAQEFKFPYKENYFDKVFSFSVFTHMQIDEIQHYFGEIKRVLKSDGICLSTFFIYNTENETYISQRNSFGFPVAKDGYRLMNENVTSGNIAIHESKLKQMLQEEGLELVELVEGFWKDEVRDVTKAEYQDVVVFKNV